jgi:hypothetical protein
MPQQVGGGFSLREIAHVPGMKESSVDTALCRGASNGAPLTVSEVYAGVL